MKHKKTVACMLAAFFCTLPFAACAAPTQDEVLLPPEETETPLPDEPSVSPETPALPPAAEEPVPPSEEPPAEEPPAEEPAAPPAAVVPEPTPEIPVSRYVKVLTNGLNVRKGAGTQYASLGTVQDEILLKFLAKEGSWYKTYFRGSIAYVSANAQYTSISTLEAGKTAVENVIEEGLKYMGVPYVYGATRYHDGNGNLLKGFTAGKFDCSSLMQYIFYKGAGVLLNVTTRTQISQGKEVKKSEIKRGDLLFFTNATRKDYVGIERVGHVALYLGDNFILHTASDYAKVEQISALRWSYYISARRVL